MFHFTIPLSAGIGALFQFSFDFSIYRQVFLIADGMLKAMKKTIWKSILCAMLVTLTACILCMREAVAIKANIDHLLGITDERENKAQER